MKCAGTLAVLLVVEVCFTTTADKNVKVKKKRERGCDLQDD